MLCVPPPCGGGLVRSVGLSAEFFLFVRSACRRRVCRCRHRWCTPLQKQKPITIINFDRSRLSRSVLRVRIVRGVRGQTAGRV